MPNPSPNDRSILQVEDSFVTMEGPGIPIRRAIPSRRVQLADVDPMLLLDHFEMEKSPAFQAGEGTHPHRGFEVLSYLIAGQMNDQGEDGKIQQVLEGGLQKITTGSGIVHGGAPMEGGRHVNGLQIWINLAKKDKKLKPEYQLIAPGEIPESRTATSVTRILAGPGSPTRLHTPALFLDVKVQAGAPFEVEVPEAYQGYAYLLEGDGRFGAEQTPASATQIAVLGPGGRLRVQAGSQGLRFFLAAGMPHREPMNWRGPFVD